MSNQTLLEFLTDVPDDRIVKIGCKEGTNFVVVCRKDELAEKLVVLEEVQSKKYKREFESAKRDLQRKLESPPTLTSFARELCAITNQDKATYTYEEYIRQCNMWLVSIKKAKISVDQWDCMCKIFRPYLERDVLDHFEANKLVVGDELAIIVTGKDKGIYWNLEEAINGVPLDEGDEDEGDEEIEKV